MLGTIRFLPLDLPPFEYKQKVLDTFNPSTEFYFWGEEYIAERDRDIPLHIPMPIRKNVHPELVNYVQTYFPFTEITLLKLVRANKDVKPHVDDSYVDYKGPSKDYNLISKEFRDHQVETDPCGYRLVIAGDRKSLYVCDGAPNVVDGELIYGEHTNKKYCEMPADTDCFVLKSYGSMHGVDKTINDENRLLLFVIGWLDTEKHTNLIKKSMRKYNKYAITERKNVLNA
jgi:hypothetical protein